MAQLDEARTISDTVAAHVADHNQLHAKANYVFDVTDFGATGDGATDDAAAIQLAIDEGGDVYFPPPATSYLVKSTLTVSTDGQTLFGDGLNTQILANAATFNIITIATNTDYVTIRDLWLRGAAADDSTVQYSVSAASNTTTNVTIRDCRLSHGNNGIVTGSGTDWIIDRCRFDTLVGKISGTGYGVLAPDASVRTTVTACKFVGSASNGRHAIYFSVGNTYSIATTNSIEAFNETAILLSASSAQAGVIGALIKGNTIRGGGTSGTVESAGIALLGKISHSTVHGNTIISFDNDGIILNDAGSGGLCVRNTIKNNDVILSGLVGIRVLGSKDCAVIGNFIYNSSQDSSGTHVGIRVVSSGSFGTEVADGTRVIGNVSFGSDQRSAYALDTAAPVPTNTVATGNMFLAGDVAGEAYELNVATVTSQFFGNSSDQTAAKSSDDIKGHLSESAALNFGAIAANTTAELTITVTGVATTGWTVLVTPEGSPEAGLVWSGQVSASNTVTVRLGNVTVGAINPASRTYRVDCWRH